MTDMNSAYIVVLETSQREDVDRIKDDISCIRGVISVEPIPEDIPEHIAEERIANEFSEKFSEMSCSITKFLSERIERGKRHRKVLKDVQEYFYDHSVRKENSVIRCDLCGFPLDDRGVCQNINCDEYQYEAGSG